MLVKGEIVLTNKHINSVVVVTSTARSYGTEFNVRFGIKLPSGDVTIDETEHAPNGNTMTRSYGRKPTGEFLLAFYPNLAKNGYELI